MFKEGTKTMVTWNTLTITGYEQKPVPNTFIRQRDETSHAAIVLPGLGYTAQMPLLYYVANLLVAQNADVLQVNYNYIDAFRGLDSAEQHRWLAADSDAAYRTFIALRSYTHLTVVGKSLGTLAMAHLFATHDFSTPPTALWLTPVLTSAAVREQITAFAGPSLIVIGTADSFYDPDLLAAIGETSTRRFAIIEGADHGMNVNNDVFQSLQALEQTLHAIADFLNGLSRF
jgi:predicted alpha/beta-hydrolase family hydrolase